MGKYNRRVAERWVGWGLSPQLFFYILILPILIFKCHRRLATSIARAAGTMLTKSAVDHSRQDARRLALGLTRNRNHKSTTSNMHPGVVQQLDQHPSIIVHAILCATGREATSSAATALAALFGEGGVQDLATVMEWDANDVTQFLTSRPAWDALSNALKRSVRRLLWLSKMQPQLDPSGRFSSHLRLISRAWMDRYPDLWRLPVRFAIRMQREKTEDVPLLIAIARRIVDVALQQNPQRTPERVTRSTLLRLGSLLTAWKRCMDPSEPSFRSLFTGVVYGRSLLSQ